MYEVFRRVREHCGPMISLYPLVFRSFVALAPARRAAQVRLTSPLPQSAHDAALPRISVRGFSVVGIGGLLTRRSDPARSAVRRSRPLRGSLADRLTFLGTLDSVERQVEDTVDVMPMSWILV